MKLELFTLCDFAADYGGKLNVIGIFDTLGAKQAPAVHPQCSVTAKMRFEKIEEGRKVVKISIADDDGKPALPAIECPIQVTAPPGVPSVSINVVLNIERLKLERFGEYSIDLALDGRHEGSIPLYVRQIP
jgi:hypothetical protein